MAGPSLDPAQAAAIQSAFAKRYDLRGPPRFQPYRAHVAGNEDASQSGPAMSGAPAMASHSQPVLVTLPKPSLAIRALNNLSYGATPATIAEFNAFGSTDTARLTGYVGLAAQLERDRRQRGRDAARRTPVTPRSTRPCRSCGPTTS